MITFVGWKWYSEQTRSRARYTAEHANVWNAMLRRHYKGPIRTILVTDDPTGVDFETFPLWNDCMNLFNPSGTHLPSCYRRLRLFDKLTLAEMDIDQGDRVVSLDLDVVIVRDITTMFAEMTNFKGWKGIGAHNPVIYNGTMFMHRAGTMQHLWTDFDPQRSPRDANQARYFGSDQGYLSWKLQGRASGWTSEDGILSYTSNMGNTAMSDRSVLPPHARIVSFNGKRKPWEDAVQAASPWIKQHWRM